LPRNVARSNPGVRIEGARSPTWIAIRQNCRL
jgi:hypothetical protein